MLKPKYEFEQLVEVRSTGECGTIHEVFRSEKIPDEIVYKIYMEDFSVKFYNESSIEAKMLRAEELKGPERKMPTPKFKPWDRVFFRPNNNKWGDVLQLVDYGPGFEYQYKVQTPDGLCRQYLEGDLEKY